MKSEIKLNEIFQKARTTPVEASFEKTKEVFLASIGKNKVNAAKGKTSLFTLKNGLFMLVIISTIAISIFLIPWNEANDSNKKVSSVEINELTEKSELKSKKRKALVKEPEVKPISKMEMELIVNELELVTDPVVEKLLLEHTMVEHKKPKLLQPFKFPVLTEKEKSDNEKRKKKMVKALSKFDKKTYTYIPSGSFDYHGETYSVQAFIMQTAEVTNIEYKTFLFDLLINNKKDAFLIARPDQTMWTKMFGDSLISMQNLYFSDEAFEEYPVVNVSRKGAEMYCVWLTKEVNKILKSKGEPLMNDLRLPVRAEWEKAASGTGEFMPFPWGGPLAQNEKGCYLANYHTPQLIDNKTDGATYTAKTKTYIPNTYGLFNMSGNVAEMVSEGYDFSGGKRIAKGPGTAGGGWMSPLESIKIAGKDEHRGVTTAHPNIGFRVVTSYMNTSK